MAKVLSLRQGATDFKLPKTERVSDDLRRISKDSKAIDTPRGRSVTFTSCTSRPEARLARQRLYQEQQEGQETGPEHLDRVTPPLERLFQRHSKGSQASRRYCCSSFGCQRTFSSPRSAQNASKRRDLLAPRAHTKGTSVKDDAGDLMRNPLYHVLHSHLSY